MAVALQPDPKADITWSLMIFDGTISETHTGKAEVTDQSVEEGSDISDNVRSVPTDFDCEVFVTNTPNSAGPFTSHDAGQVSTQSLEVPKYSEPFALTPGFLFRSAGNFIGSLLSGPEQTQQVTTLQFGTVFDAVLDTQTKLLDALEKAVSFTVFTSTQTYENMVLTSVVMPREFPGGASFSLSLRQIRTVSTQTVTAPEPSTPRGAPSQVKGSQSTKPGDPEPGSVSVLKQLKSALSGSLFP